MEQSIPSESFVAAKLANMDVGNPTGNNQFESRSANLPIGRISQPQAAKLLNVSDRTLRDAKVVIRQTKEQVGMIKKGEKEPMAASSSKPLRIHFRGAGMRVSILQDHLVNDFPTGDAFPPEKVFTNSIKFFIVHHSTTSMTLHLYLLVLIFLLFIRKYLQK